MTTTLEKTNSLIYKANKSTGKGYIYVTIRLNDECKNGHQDFAITATIYERLRQGEKFDSIDGRIINGIKYNFSSGGCCHDEIVKYFPEFKIFVNLHLCDYTGVPMHGIANGLYHLRKGFNNTKPDSLDFEKEFCSYYRINPAQFKILKNAKNTLQYALALKSLGILEQWQNEANEAIKILENLTGKTFLVDSSRTQLDWPKEDEFKKEAERQANGYYSAESEAKRELEAKNKIVAELESDRDKGILKHNTEFAVKMAVLEAGGKKALDNCIFYNHSNELSFNWRGYDHISQELINKVVSSIKLPEGITIKNEKK